MAVLMIIFCFVIALIIYFGRYYEEDMKAMDLKKSQPKGDREDDYFILPFFEENRDGSHDDLLVFREDDPEAMADDDPDFEE